MTSFDAMNTDVTRILVRDRQRTIRQQATRSPRTHESPLRVRTRRALVRAGQRLAVL